MKLYKLALVLPLLLSGCGLSGDVVDSAIGKSTDRFYVAEKIKTEEAQANAAVAQAAAQAAQAKACKPFVAPPGLDPQSIANMKMAHEMGCSSRAFADAMITMARGGKAEFADYISNTPMPKGVVAETLEAAVPLVKAVADSPALMVYGVAEAIGKGVGTTINNSGTGNVSYSQSSIGDGNTDTTVNNSQGCSDGTCGYDDGATELPDDIETICDECTYKRPSDGICFISSAYICSCDSYAAGRCVR